MRRSIPLLGLLCVVALVAAACGATKDTGFPPPEPSGSADPCAEEAEASTEPVEEAIVIAEGLAFDRTELLLKADTEVKIEFRNCDASIPHNLSVYDGKDAEAPPILKEQEFGGIQTVVYTVPATDPGKYYYQCDVHPNMNGTATFQ